MTVYVWKCDKEFVHFLHIVAKSPSAFPIFFSFFLFFFFSFFLFFLFFLSFFLSFFPFFFSLTVYVWKCDKEFVHFLHIVAKSPSAFPK